MTAACAHLHLCISTHAPMGNSGRTPPHSAPAQSSALPAAAEQCGMTHTTAPSCPPRVQASLGLWGECALVRERAGRLMTVPTELMA
eukprot:scaffold257859_cov20-Tisochrysis_lutea.AAC.1